MLNASLQAGGTVLFGLLAAACWGGGDFGGSIAVKKTGGTIQSSLVVVVIGHLCSLFALAVAAFLVGSAQPSGTSMLWGVGGGIISGVSLIAFYFALAGGHMGSAASVSGLLCAAVPAAVSELTEGLANWKQCVGFGLAIAAIWLIASVTGQGAASRRTTLLAALSGVGFGIYFVALRQAGESGVLWPTASARVGSAGICTILLLVSVIRNRFQQRRDANSLSGPNQTQSLQIPKRAPRQVTPVALTWILGGATLDLCGNLCFMQATRMGRLDVAAVLASIYPAGTILLAAALLHERTTARQRWGMALALVAVVLITL